MPYQRLTVTVLTVGIRAPNNCGLQAVQVRSWPVELLVAEEAVGQSPRLSRAALGTTSNRSASLNAPDPPPRGHLIAHYIGRFSSQGRLSSAISAHPLSSIQQRCLRALEMVLHGGSDAVGIVAF